MSSGDSDSSANGVSRDRTLTAIARACTAAAAAKSRTMNTSAAVPGPAAQRARRAAYQAESKRRSIRTTNTSAAVPGPAAQRAARAARQAESKRRSIAVGTKRRLKPSVAQGTTKSAKRRLESHQSTSSLKFQKLQNSLVSRNAERSGNRLQSPSCVTTMPPRPYSPSIYRTAASRPHSRSPSAQSSSIHSSRSSSVTSSGSSSRSSNSPSSSVTPPPYSPLSVLLEPSPPAAFQFVSCAPTLPTLPSGFVGEDINSPPPDFAGHDRRGRVRGRPRRGHGRGGGRDQRSDLADECDPAVPSRSDLAIPSTSRNHPPILSRSDECIPSVPLTESTSGDLSASNNDREHKPLDLDSHISDVAGSVESLISAQHSLLPKAPRSFEWTEDFTQFSPQPEVFTGPNPGPTIAPKTPYDAFVAIWDRDIVSRIVTETNRYAEQTISRKREEGTLADRSRFHEWKPTFVDEIYVFFAVFMFMGLVPLIRYEHFWRTDELLQIPGMRSLMSMNRFRLLKSLLCFVNSQDLNVPTDRHTSAYKLYKLSPIIDHLYDRFQELYNLNRYITIDESLTLFKGRLSWKHNIKSKRVRLGIKTFELCCSETGYLFRFYVCMGKSDDSDSLSVPDVDLALTSTKTVLRLLRGLEHRGHCVVMDNYYNSPSLTHQLKTDGYDVLGTLKVDRTHTPEVIKGVASYPRSMPQGTIIGRHCGLFSIIAWRSKRVVTMISTLHGKETSKGRTEGRLDVKPVSVSVYSEKARGVDRKDRLLSAYLMERKKHVKWHVKMFLRLMNVSVDNARILLNEYRKRHNLRPIPHNEFREALIKEIVAKHLKHPMSTAPTPLTRRSNLPEDILRLSTDVVHQPDMMRTDRKTGTERRKLACARCKIRNKGKGVTKRVSSICITCNVPLCFDTCWAEWHSMPFFPESE